MSDGPASSRADKIAEIREQMKAKEADTFILTSLDDIAWLLNIRGNDIHCCPVVLSYLVMMENELRLYANAAAFSEEIRVIWKQMGKNLPIR